MPSTITAGTNHCHDGITPMKTNASAQQRAAEQQDAEFADSDDQLLHREAVDRGRRTRTPRPSTRRTRS